MSLYSCPRGPKPEVNKRVRTWNNRVRRCFVFVYGLYSSCFCYWYGCSIQQLKTISIAKIHCLLIRDLLWSILLSEILFTKNYFSIVQYMWKNIPFIHFCWEISKNHLYICGYWGWVKPLDLLCSFPNGVFDWIYKPENEKKVLSSSFVLDSLFSPFLGVLESSQ